MLVDITERKQAEESQALLVRKLVHRVKNTLAVILAMARQSLRATPANGFGESILDWRFEPDGVRCTIDLALQ